MPFPTDTKYPATATNAAWQKKKSKLDKLGATGVGALLTAAENEWKAIKFTDLDDKVRSTDLAAAKARLTKANTAYAQVVKTRKALAAAIKKAETQAKNTKLNKTSTTALAAIVSDLKKADKRLGIMDDLPGMVQIDINTLEKAEAERAAKAAATLANVEIKSGGTLLATAGKGQRQPDNTYVVTDITWNVDHRMRLEFLQKKCTLKARDGDGKPFSKELTLAGIKGDDLMRFKP
jgi:hypothetical protein